jgi:cadmium resistance protein CadD (predicted permease)
MAPGLDWFAGPLAFLLTDIDDLFVLVAFFADRAIRPRHVVIGQFAGIAALLASATPVRAAGLVAGR